MNNKEVIFMVVWHGIIMSFLYYTADWFSPVAYLFGVLFYLAFLSDKQ